MTPAPRPLVYVWCCATQLGKDPAVRQAAWDLLSEAERAEVAALRHGTRGEDRSLQVLLARALSRRALSAAHPGVRPKDWPLAHRASGAPYLRASSDEGAAGAPYFSLSHTSGMVACAATAWGPIGVDVEALGRRLVHAEAIARRLFADQERAYVMAASQKEGRDHAFLTLWTLKEAYLKAAGLGLAHLTSKIAFEVGHAGDVRSLCPAAAGQRVLARSCTVASQYCLAVVMFGQAGGAPLAPDVQLREGWL